VPVVLTVAAAPAFAVSSGPLTLDVTEQPGPGGKKKLRVTFAGGTPGPMSPRVTLTQVLKGATVITMTPPLTVDASGPAGHVDSSVGNSYVAGATYTISYVYNSINYVQTITA
jgi:hypothetical protein